MRNTPMFQVYTRDRTIVVTTDANVALTHLVEDEDAYGLTVWEDYAQTISYFKSEADSFASHFIDDLELPENKLLYEVFRGSTSKIVTKSPIVASSLLKNPNFYVRVWSNNTVNCVIRKR